MYTVKITKTENGIEIGGKFTFRTFDTVCGFISAMEDFGYKVEIAIDKNDAIKMED